jgi:Na+-driven multidrug efflux pump
MPQNMGVTAVPRTFGILSIVFASLVLVGSLFSMVGLIVPVMLSHAPPSARPEDAQALKLVSTMYLGMGIIGCVLAVMSSLLLALGIGQLRYRRWAAVWSTRWAIVALGSIVVMAIILTSTASSVAGDVAGAAHATDAASARHVGAAFGAIYAVMLVLFYAPYPILLLAYFSRDRVRAAMTA